MAIVGAGFGGLGAAIRLRQHGFRDFLIFDQAADVGGTWRDNTYPGCACDVPSHLYSFSFAPNPGWRDTFSGQPEIWDYLCDCVTRFGLAGRLRLAHYVASKHGVAGLTKSAALECSLMGIRVNCVCPGVIGTKMIVDYVRDIPEVREAMTSMQPLNRMGSPEEIADAVLWLCSDQASFVTGAIFFVDGGIAAQSGPYPPMPEHI